MSVRRCRTPGRTACCSVGRHNDTPAFGLPPVDTPAGRNPRLHTDLRPHTHTSRVQAGPPGIQVAAKPTPPPTWRMNTSSSPTTLGDVIFVLPTPTSAPSRGPVLDWATDVSLSLDHQSETVYPALCDSLTRTWDSSNNCWKHVCLSETAAHLWLFVFDVPCINSFTCLLTHTYIAYHATM